MRSSTMKHSMTACSLPVCCDHGGEDQPVAIANRVYLNGRWTTERFPSIRINGGLNYFDQTIVSKNPR